MRKQTIATTISLAVVAAVVLASVPPVPVGNFPVGWTLVFEDNFDGAKFAAKYNLDPFKDFCLQNDPEEAFAKKVK